MITIVVKANESLELCGNVIVHKQDTCKEFNLNDLHKLSILTNNQGPVLDDVAMALFINEAIIVLPSEHACYQKFYDSLSERIDYDYGKVIEAMSCAENAEFIVWEKHEESVKEMTFEAALNDAQSNAVVALKRLAWLCIAIPSLHVFSVASSFSYWEWPLDFALAWLVFSPLLGVAVFFIVTLAKEKAREYSSALHIIALSGIYTFVVLTGFLVLGIGLLIGVLADFVFGYVHFLETITMVSAEILSIPALVFSVRLYKAAKLLRTTKAKPNHTASCFLGGISIVLALTTMFPAPAIVFGAIGILVAIIARNKYSVKTGLIMNVAGVILSIIMFPFSFQYLY